MRNEVAEMLDQLQRDRFYGSLEIKFENGEAVLLRKTETILPKKETSSFGYRETRGEKNVYGPTLHRY